MQASDVAIVGAGPYGLSAAAHLRRANGLDVRVLGEPMSFWRDQMPVGMLLRSPWGACSLSDPAGDLSLDRYEAQIGETIPRPVPLDRFVEYGRWFQEHVVPDVDRRAVAGITRDNGHFRVALDDGDELRAKRVIVATGIASFAARPRVFDALPPELVSHSSEHRDLRKFGQRDVVVVGGGQSAVESAALLHEAGARVEVLVREPIVHWLVRSSRLHRLKTLRRLLYHPADIGPAGLSWIVATPGCFKKLPLRWQDPLARRSIRPAASGWLVPRTRDVRISTARCVTAAEESDGRVSLVLDDGTTRHIDHVLLATGYRVDVRRLGFLPKELLAEIEFADGYPILSPSFESTAPRLHFVGAPAAYSFGPLMRFVAGTRFAARALARGVGATRARRGGRSWLG